MNLLEKYDFEINEEEMAQSIQSIASNLDNMSTNEILKDCFSLMDLTSLHPNDTVSSIKELVAKTNGIKSNFPGYPFPASICVFPNFASVVKNDRCSDEIHVTTVAGCFPASQSFLDIKVKECEMAVHEGADEVDIVLALNAFLDGDFEAAAGEIRAIRKAVDAAGVSCGRKVVLKVILETGVLRTQENIAKASFLAMEAGADFVKTSTGKVEVNATPMAAYVMCSCIKKYYEKTGRMVGFKAAGGISSAKDALCYYFIVSSVLGHDWLNKNYLRFGVSHLGNSLISAIEQTTINYF